MYKKKFRNLVTLLLSLTAMIFLNGCVAAIAGHKDSMNKFDEDLKSNKCDFAEIDEKIKKDDDTILWGIQGGLFARLCHDYKKSNELFDKAENKYKESVDKDNVVNNVFEGTASVLVNNNINEYEGNTYEKIMVNTYKALNFASINDYSNARIEFNRALDRQRRAKEYFEKEIKEKKKELSKKSEKNKDNIEKKDVSKKDIPLFDSMSIAQNNETQKVIYKEFNDVLSDFKAYPDFVNPFTTYVSGIYFLLNGDSKKAKELLKESNAMAKDNKQIKSDYNLSKKITSLKKSKEKYAWVIFENGKSMVKEEIRIDIPLFLFTNNIQYTGIALPKVVERGNTYAYLDVNGKRTDEICNMDRVIKTEFKKRFPTIVTEAVLNTVIKTVVQKQLNDNGGVFAGLAGALYQGLTNKADVRSWTALPKNFQSTRVTLTDKPIVVKNDKGQIIKSIVIPKGKNAMIYVKSQDVGNDRVQEILF